MDLPDGVELVGTLAVPHDDIESVCWSPDGNLLATITSAGSATVWDPYSQKALHTFSGHSSRIVTTAFDEFGRLLAVGRSGGIIELWRVDTWRLATQIHAIAAWGILFSPRDDLLITWAGGHVGVYDTASGHLQFELPFHNEAINACAFDRSGSILAIADEEVVQFWDMDESEFVSRTAEHPASLYSIAFSPTDGILATCGTPGIHVWDQRTGRLLQTLESHTDEVLDIAFMADGRFLASASLDGSIRIWDCTTWSLVTVIPHRIGHESRETKALACHPTMPLLAAVGERTPLSRNGTVHLWKLDPDVLLSAPRPASIAYTSAKIVLLGESGAGKTGLGYRLAHNAFKEHASTHGQQFWLLDQLSSIRADGTQCEAILWDLAGQPDYRIIHTLFLDDADVALIVFDPTDNEPLQGVDYWLSQLCSPNREVILVAARSDRGTGRLSSEDIARFCAERGIRSSIVTSARTGEGISELVELMRSAAHWEQRPPTVTTATFKWIKEAVLGLKEGQSVILSIAELRSHLTSDDPAREFTNQEMLAAVGHLANHGYVAVLKTSQGETRILLKPDLLNNVAASMVLEARRNPRGLGSLAEQSVLGGEYAFPELGGLSEGDREVLLDSAIAMFLAHHVCFREVHPLTSRVYLVFPELINLRRPAVKHPEPTSEGTAYTVTGAIENVYASLVVLLGFTDVFTRTSQWRDQAEYTVGTDLICGFRQEAEREGELDFVLYHGTSVGEPARTLFQGLFESFLARRDLTVLRLDPVRCRNGHLLDRAAIRGLAGDSDHAFCMRCGDKVVLPKADVPLQLTRDIDEQHRTADQRARFEQALFRLKAYAVRSDARELTCFISYAWGNPDHEQWVERVLATDLTKAGLTVLLDRWENARIGASVSRFVDQAHGADRVVVVGTPSYLTKYTNNHPMGAFVLAAEGDLIGNRMIGSEQQKLTVLPILLDGTPATSLPPLLQGRVYSDFRQPERYFTSALDLILSMHGIPPRDQLAIELRQSLADPSARQAAAADGGL